MPATTPKGGYGLVGDMLELEKYASTLEFPCLLFVTLKDVSHLFRFEWQVGCGHAQWPDGPHPECYLVRVESRPRRALRTFAAVHLRFGQWQRIIVDRAPANKPF